MDRSCMTHGQAAHREREADRAEDLRASTRQLDALRHHLVAVLTRLGHADLAAQLAAAAGGNGVRVVAEAAFALGPGSDLIAAALSNLASAYHHLPSRGRDIYLRGAKALLARLEAPGALRLEYSGSGYATVDAAAANHHLSALLEEHGIPDPDQPETGDGSNLAALLEAAAREGAIALPDGLEIGVIGDDDTEGSGLIVEVRNAAPAAWNATTGWRDITNYWPARGADDRYAPAEMDDDARAVWQARLAHAAMQTCVGEINTVLHAGLAGGDTRSQVQHALREFGGTAAVEQIVQALHDSIELREDKRAGHSDYSEQDIAAMDFDDELCRRLIGALDAPTA